MKRVLIATDGSDQALKAAELGTELATKMDARRQPDSRACQAEASETARLSERAAPALTFDRPDIALPWRRPSARCGQASHGAGTTARSPGRRPQAARSARSRSRGSQRIRPKVAAGSEAQARSTDARKKRGKHANPASALRSLSTASGMEVSFHGGTSVRWMSPSGTNRSGTLSVFFARRASLPAISDAILRPMKIRVGFGPAAWSSSRVGLVMAVRTQP